MQRMAAKRRRGSSRQAATLKNKTAINYLLGVKLNVVYDKTS